MRSLNMGDKYMKYIKLVITSLLLCMGILLVSCGRNKETTPTEIVTPSTLQNATPTISEGASPTITEAVSPEPTAITPGPWENSENVISWCFGTPYISEENRQRINQILYEKGIDCRIDFIDSERRSSKEYADWVINEARPDILSSGGWSRYSPGINFIKENFLSLNDYLSTEGGKSLYGSFCEAEWKSVTLDNIIYTVPKSKMPQWYNTAVYLAVNDVYADWFEDFDGTYASLRKIYDSISDPELRILFDEVSGEKVSALFGYKMVYHGRLPYDPQTKKLLSPALVGEEEGALCKVIYEDIRNGIIINRQYDDTVPEKCLAMVYTGIRAKTEGYSVVFCLKEAPYDVNVNGTYGINRNTEKKELALRILTECFSEPGIASILNWRKESGRTWEERTYAWEERTELMAEERLNELAGFFPKLTAEEEAAIMKYEQDLTSLCNDMYKYDAQKGESALNKYFQPKASVIIASSDIYSVGIEGLNRELETWFAQEK